MKKKLLIACLFMTAFSAFAKISMQKLQKKIEKSGYFDITTRNDFWKEPSAGDKYPVIINYDTNEKFLQSLQIGPSSEICAGKSLEDIKAELKKGTNIYGVTYNEGYRSFRWVEDRYTPVSVRYELSRHFFGAGVYVFLIFDKDGIYSVCIRDIVNTYERNSDYDDLSEYFFFQKGQMEDAGRGMEQVQGYVCKSEEAAEKFYKALLSEAPGLPESVLKFQRAARLLEKIIIEL